MKITKNTLKQLIKEELQEIMGQTETDDISMGVSTRPRCDFTDLQEIVQTHMRTLIGVSNGDRPVSGYDCADPDTRQALKELDTAIKDIALVLIQYKDFY
jgi:hypothetical protein